jgi:hypothetical protein
LIVAVLGPLDCFQDSEDKEVPLAALAVPCRKLEFPSRLWALPALTTGAVLEELALAVELTTSGLLVFTSAELPVPPLTVTDTVEEADCPRLLVAVRVKT